MQKTQKRNLILYIIILVSSMLILVTSTFAWFAFSAVNSGDVMIYTGDMDLNMTIKQGIDSARDGNLDEFDKGNGLIVDTNSSRGDINKYLFTPLDKEAITEQKQLSTGSYLTYKIIIENPIANDTNALVSVNFANLAEYYMELMTMAENEWQNTLIDNTGRVRYSLKNIVVRNYTQQASEESSLELGYSKLVASSLQNEAIAGVKHITNVNTAGKDKFYMWEVSHQEEFTDNILVKSNEVVEIMFQFKCIGITETIREYTRYQEEWINSLKDPDKIAHVKKVIAAELVLMVDINIHGAIELKFTIEEIYIHATQTTKEE